MQNTETGYASSVNVTKSRTRRKVTGEPRTLKGVRVVRRGGARKRVSRLRETPRRAPYPVWVRLPWRESLIIRVHDRELWNFDPRQEGQVSKVCDHDTCGPTC